MDKAKAYDALVKVLKHYFSQGPCSYKQSTGHVPHQFKPYIGCYKCKLEEGQRDKRDKNTS